MPRVTVVIAAKDAESHLGETLDSVRAQTFTDWGLVVVDDGSTDNTAAIVEQASVADGRIRLVSLPESVGAYAAANVALLAASSEYVARLDADDVAVPRRLECQVAALDAAPQMSASATGWQALRPEGVDPHVRLAPSRRNGALKWMQWQRNGLVHSSMFLRTTRFQELGGYGPNRVAEDYRLWTKLARAGEILVLDEALTLYRIWPGQITAQTGARDDPQRTEAQLEHIRACTGDESWTARDARDFKYMGRHADFSVERALDLLDRWEAAWRADETLTSDDKTELAGYAAYRRVGHVRHSLGNDRLGAARATRRIWSSIVPALRLDSVQRERWR